MMLLRSALVERGEDALARSRSHTSVQPPIAQRLESPTRPSCISTFFGTWHGPYKGRNTTAHEDELGQHVVRCAYCRGSFDLLMAEWCEHVGVQKSQASKVCPWCQTCVCHHPLYDNPDSWAVAPPAFQKHGFRKLFLLYI